MATDHRLENPSKQQLEAEIEILRRDLGETVTALSHKLDVKTRVKRRIRSTSLTERAVAFASVLGVGGLVVWRRRS